MRRVTINENDAGQRADKFLSKFLPSMPKSLMYKAIRKKRVKVNGKKCAPEQILCAGDELLLYINDEFFLKEEKNIVNAPKIDVIYEDENILLADKPGGVIMHGKGEISLTDMLISYLVQKGEYDEKAENSFSPAFCNRLDKNTRGLVIAAKSAKALRAMNGLIKRREVKKFYLCRVCGFPKEKNGVISTYLKKDSSKNKVFVCGAVPGAHEAVTRYKTLGSWEKGAIIEAELITGRTHQIRAHMAHLCIPISGDVKYGAPKDGKSSFQELISYRTEFHITEEDSPLYYLNGRSFSIIQNINDLNW